MPLGGEGIWGGLPPLCHHQKERTKPQAPRVRGLQAAPPRGPQHGGCPPTPPPRGGGQGLASPRLRHASQELKKPCPVRGQKDSEPPDPQMLHEHIVRGARSPPRPPGGGRAPPALSRPGLWPVPQPRRLLSSLTQKVLHLPARPAPHRDGRHVSLRFFADVGGVGGRAGADQVWFPPSISSTGFKSGFRCPLIRPPRSGSPPFCLTCCGL